MRCINLLSSSFDNFIHVWHTLSALSKASSQLTVRDNPFWRRPTLRDMWTSSMSECSMKIYINPTSAGSETHSSQRQRPITRNSRHFRLLTVHGLACQQQTDEEYGNRLKSGSVSEDGARRFRLFHKLWHSINVPYRSAEDEKDGLLLKRRGKRRLRESSCSRWASPLASSRISGAAARTLRWSIFISTPAAMWRHCRCLIFQANFAATDDDRRLTSVLPPAHSEVVELQPIMDEYPARSSSDRYTRRQICYDRKINDAMRADVDRTPSTWWRKLERQYMRGLALNLNELDIVSAHEIPAGRSQWLLTKLTSTITKLL